MANKKRKPARANRISEIAKGSALIQKFVERGPIYQSRIDKPRGFSVGLRIGELLAVEYRASNGIGYRHAFKKSSRPLLIVSSDGKQLAIAGGKYRFTTRGITDL